MTALSDLHLIGCASGMAGVSPGSGTGPLVLKASPFMSGLDQQGIHYQWDGVVIPSPATAKAPVDESVSVLCRELAQKVSQAVVNRQLFSVIGGDHSCAIGTWSGVYDALHQQGDIGLIWIDAHMDAHTPETSESGRIHGMPVASLLGYGFPSLAQVLHAAPKIKPDNLCLIGVRSFESGEAAFLKQLNVKIYFMDEVKARGFTAVLNEARDWVSRHTVGYGLSLDLDGLEPKEVPGVDVPEPDGITTKALFEGLSMLVSDPKLVATEIVEFNPERDEDHLTEKLIVSLLALIAKGRKPSRD